MPDDIDKNQNTLKSNKINITVCQKLNDDKFDVAKAINKNPAVLDEVVDILKMNPAMTGEVRGYTDTTGALELNRKLSDARAKAVRDYLVKQGIAPERIRAMGFGAAHPVAGNDTPEGRAQNRRVELHPDL
jgi:outer membrane protein OmpA-like peptidoglycan-associated protein